MLNTFHSNAGVVCRWFITVCWHLILFDDIGCQLSDTLVLNVIRMQGLSVTCPFYQVQWAERWDIDQLRGINQGGYMEQFSGKIFFLQNVSSVYYKKFLRQFCKNWFKKFDTKAVHRLLYFDLNPYLAPITFGLGPLLWWLSTLQQSHRTVLKLFIWSQKSKVWSNSKWYKRFSKFLVTIKTRGVGQILASFNFLLPLFLLIPQEALFRQL